ncbi:RNA polymerase factor sigma-54 [Alkalibacter rhizosphaerae]|uniref:RNA polymerase factor sigma-54 n=1 Tax=Alkalibacter rhizosphaerae TaxID=2815577 RepID=A0A974XH43_9FIRM|nr:RNA polymerase factor sigma-54 [Alkalibacter rhizosphaerae]QSX08208.1 RNA polymerase factor sigma-54 [Alkalibacter rhizosphaerae]
MRLEVGTTINQQQKQQLSANVIHSIRLLTYNTLELSKYLEEQLLDNPMLEMVEERQEEEREDEINWVEFIKNTYSYDETTFLPGKDPLDVSVQPQTLKDVLLEQLHYQKLTEVEIFIGEWLIDYVDDSGYLTIEVEEVASFMQVPVTLVEQMVERIQSFEPSGVGAGNLGECLSIQLIAKGIKDPKIHRLVLHHLEDLAHRRRKILEDTLNISNEQLEKYLAIIQGLEPRPGQAYSSSEPVYILPDLFVGEIHGKVLVRHNKYQFSKLVISPYYLGLLKKSSDERALQFIKERLESAKLLVNSLEKREETVLSVTEAIFKRQIMFLKEGDTGLVPLTMKEIADEVDVHESTVSRVVKNKYVLCERGVYPLKHFFPSRLDSRSGDGISSGQVKEIIREWIQNENKEKPYSDQKLTNMLQDQGFDVSRRTVMKYREQLGFLSSRERKTGL